jgi:hypothetical protein
MYLSISSHVLKIQFIVMWLIQSNNELYFCIIVSNIYKMTVGIEGSLHKKSNQITPLEPDDVNLDKRPDH